ncbi:MAG: 16S rRNA (cytosine(1402)-N(4))-methyltransferase RsmH [Patescibacteria group bacterium]|nr:16S rRNA (cytosine(1402)-N(4))-methyltransferase RsmH [Patescibacteria group bacterium]
MPHVPVLLKETLELLNVEEGEICIDATFGGGGHSKALAEKVGSSGKVLALDADAGAVEKFQISPIRQTQGRDFKFQNVAVVHGNFRDLNTLAKGRGFEQVDAILFDLGLSSMELDDATRGFSFQKDGPLDMRFDQTVGRTAEKLLAESTEAELARIFKEYGEERFAKRIARAIVAARVEQRLTSTSQLFEIIKHSLPGALRHRAGDFARRVFQALRIAVNGELESLELALPQALALLKPGGRLAVISFHSLEDRIVKRFLVGRSRGCVCPPEFPECVCGKSPELRILTRKPVTASLTEQLENARSKSAKLRVAIKSEG